MPRYTSEDDRLSDDQPLYFGADQLYTVEYVSSVDRLTISGTAATVTSNGGPLLISSANGGATSGNSGHTTIVTGDSVSGNTGNVQIDTGDASNGNSGRIDISVGNASGSVGSINIGAGGGEEIGFYGEGPVVQAAHIADPAESIAGNNAAIDAILVVLENLGLVAAS